MEVILKEFKSYIKIATSSDHYEEISVIIYLASLTQDEIITNEIEAASNILHCALTSLYENHYNIIPNMLNEERYIVLSEKSTGNCFKVFIKDLWLFRIILINSLKHSDIVNNAFKDTHANLFASIVDHILKNIEIVKSISLHLLRTLLLIVTKRKDTLSPNLNRAIVNHMNKIAISPNAVFRHYACEISKQIILSLPTEETMFLDISLLPIRGVDMCDIVKCFSKTFIRENRCDIIKKVLTMFLRNVESKDGGALYECLLFYSFGEWKEEIWPAFLDNFKSIDYEGEIFQSLLKYWIPMNVNAYKNEFYNFLRNEPIDHKLKGYILLESKRKGCTFDDDILKRDISTTFHNLETRDLALKAATTYHKKILWPATYEIDIVTSYLYSNTNTSLEEEESKSLRLFFSQIFLHAHNELKKSDGNISHFTPVLEIVYKYCCSSLKTDFSEVGAEIIFILWTVATGNHKDLLLSYKLDKKDFYSNGENLFYLKLKEKDKWWFENIMFQQELSNCFLTTNGSSTCLTKLFTKFFDARTFLNTIHLKKMVAECALEIGLDSEKRIKNYSEILFKNDHCSKENLEFLDELIDGIVNLDIPREHRFSDDMIFKTVLHLEIIKVALKYDKCNTEKLHKLVEKSLSVVENIIVNNNDEVNYRTTKILEAFINEVMLCMVDNADVLWKTIDKSKVIEHLLMIVQRSNMKRPLSLSVEVLKRFGFKMNENDIDKNYKIHFLNRTLKSLCESGSKPNSKIRRSPQSRLVIHAMCSSDSNPNKPLLKWALTDLIDVISDPNTTEYGLSSALHSIEILISDNSLQCQTLPFVSDIIIQSVELFAQSSWIVRNADLQLTRAIIDRFYGVCLDICNRPKCVEDLLILFPRLSPYFYKVLSFDELDERAILVFQFFSESQIKEQICQPEISIRQFRQLFMNILQKYPNYYGKMAARSYSSTCISKEIPKEICSIVRFLKINFGVISRNTAANFIFLMQQLYEKYKNSFLHYVNKEGIKVINFAVNDLLKYLRGLDANFFDFILFKVRSQAEIVKEFKNCDSREFEKRLWLHNNVPFLFLNTKSTEICEVLDTVLSNNVLSCIQIKILTILVFRCQNNDFSNDILKDILDILFKKSICVSDNDNYLLNCYFKTILMFSRRTDILHFKNESVQFSVTTTNIYKLMIFILYFSGRYEQMRDSQFFFNLVEEKCMNMITFSEELKNDLISTLPYLHKYVPSQFQLKILKQIFYSCLFYSTHVETYNCISFITGKSYSSILNALQDFFSVENLMLHLKDKTLVIRFFNDIIKYLPQHFQKIQTDGYYSEESDILVPKLFLEKLINSEIRKFDIRN